MTAQREPFFNAEPAWLFYLLATAALAVFAWGMWARVRLWLAARAEAGPPSGAVKKAFVDVLSGRRIFRGDLAAGLCHGLIFWGFGGLFLGTIAVAADHYLFRFLTGRVYLAFSTALEVLGLMLLAGLLWALTRRWLAGPARLEKRAEFLLAPLWILAVAASGFLVEAARLAATAPAWGGASFLGASLAGLFPGGEAALPAHRVLWWGHALLSLGLMAWLPFGRLLHALAAPLSLYQQDAPLAQDLPEAEEAPRPLAGLGQRQLVNLDACTACGRCVDACPAARAGEPFQPREVMRAGKAGLALAAGGLIATASAEALEGMPWGREAWYCTTCRACLEVCPVGAAPLEIARKARAAMVEDGNAVPPQVGDALEKLFKYGNPWLAKKGKKAAWQREGKVADLSKGEEAGLVYFVGCTTSIDTRAQALANSLVKVLNAAGIVPGILGKKEPCCGDIARRLGEQGLFEEQREETRGELAAGEARELVISSPHCWDTIKSYPAAEGFTPPKAWHYSQVLADLLDQGKLAFNTQLDLKVTYHDPCYLARHNGVLSEPRRVIRALPGVELVEMAEHGRNALCCGGGGGRMWQELPGQGELSVARIKQAAATGAQAVITACPLCLIMLEDARKTAGFGEGLQVLDLNELVAMAMGLSETGA